MTIRCLIVDDEPLAVEVIRTHLAKLSDVEVIATCHDALEAFGLLRKHEVDLLFLDIQMPQLTGVDLMKALDDPPAVIFTTAHRDYAVEGFDLNAVDYLLKPISLPRLLRALDKFRTLHAATATPSATPADALNVRVDRQVVKVPLADIRYIESMSDYVQIHTTKRTLITKERISHLADKLAPHGFLRIHRSFLVPAHQVTAFTSEEVQVGEKRLPISRSYKQAVLARLRDE
ncbi:MAG TPA: LytTR family DNA-binding domain-containing protein [Rhodothermales bacterium]|nr:LytTR family DNA-binding domain-containing protein [Rhodothermales bacterium]